MFQNQPQGCRMDTNEDPSSGDESGITEQDLIDHVDILFQTSDVEESGYVPVSRIIEYLRIHTSFGENEEDLLSLVRLADPRGNNPSLTLERYREIMWQWIKQLQLGSADCNDGGSEYEDFQSDSSNRVSSVSRSGSAKDPGGSSDLGFAKHDDRFSIMENPSEEVQQYVDKIQELQFQNSKLVEENSTLQQQIYSQEESLAQSNTSNDSLVRKVKCLQEALQLRQQHDCENEEIILKLQDQKQETKHKIDCLTSDLDHLRSSNKELEANVVEHQHQMEHMTEMKRIQEIQLSERYEELRNQQNQLLSLSTTVQELKAENKDLQSKLCQSNEVLKSLKQSAECRERGDNFRQFPCSTPIKRNNSICMELRGVLEDGDHMPSPLCEKEIDEIDQVYPMFSSNDEDTEDENDPNVSIYSVSLKDELTMDMSKFMEKYQSKQASLLDDVRHFLSMGASSGEGAFTTEFLGKLEDGMFKLSQKVSSLARAKTDVDKRLGKQKKKFRKLKEENADLKDAAVDVMEDQLSWDVVTDKRLLILKDQIDQERANIKFLEKKLKDKESTFVDKNKISSAEKVLKIEIQKLQSLNKDLTEKNKKLQGKVNSLAEEVEKSHRDVENQQTKVAKLEAEKAALALERRRAEYQLIEKNEQDFNQHSTMQESNMRDNRSLSLLRSNEVLRKVAQMSGVLPYDLLLTHNQEIREHPKSQLTSPNNIYTDGGSETERQSLEHLWLDRGRISEEEIRDVETEADGCYRGDGQRRYSYQAAIDNQNCLPGEQRYPRCRSGSFQAAIEGGQKDREHGYMSENFTQLVSSRSVASEHVDCYPSMVPSYDHLDDCLAATKTSSSHGASAFSQNSSPVCYSVCDSGHTAGTVGCSGDFTVNSSYLTCTDTSHNHCDVMSKQFSSAPDDVTNTQNDDGSRLFGSQWREAADDSGCTQEDSSLKHRSGNFSDSPDAPDVIQIARLGKINTDDREELMSPKVSIPSLPSSAAELNPSSDHRTRKQQIRTETPPKTEAGKERERCGSEVKEEKREVKGTKVKNKEEVNNVIVTKDKEKVNDGVVTKDKEKVKDVVTKDKEKVKDVVTKVKDKEEMNEKIKSVKGEVGDEDNVDVTNNLLRELEKLNLSDCPTDCDLPDDVSPNSPHLKKIRQGNLAKRREQMKFLRMPDLNEHQEPGQMMTNGDGETDSSVMPGETDSSVMPSIPETLLRDLGVDQEKTEEESPDQLSEQELESKFTSLSLAFKTDKITLEKRLEIQERSRDIAEENVAKEIKGLKEALEQLNQICVDSQVRGLLLKIQKHVTVLEQASARVSSRAEVLGAVQQEKRMSKAIEIMLTHVDNLRMSHERQTAELEEARKLIQDNRPFGGSSDLGDFPGLSRRSASVCHGNAFMPKGARRRVSDAALTRSTGLPHSASVDNISESVHVMPPLRRDLAISLSEEDPRSKFQQIASVAALKNSTSSAFRKASLCKQTSTSSLLGQNLRLSQESSQTDNKMTRSVSKQHSAEEEAFQKGFEQGYKAQITGQLKQLRDQQTSITDTLDEIRDKCEEAEEGDTQEISLRDTIVSKVWEHIPEWGTASKNLRLATVIFFLFLAAVSIVLSFLPVGYAAVQVYPEYHHVNTPPV